MKRTAAIIFATALTAAAQNVPPIWYVLEGNFQQAQELADQDFVQGAGVSLRYRIRSDGRNWDLAGLGARWEARSNATSTAAVMATATAVTNVTPHYFQITLNSNHTGSAVTNWPYAFVVTLAGVDYALGTGTLNIPASAWTGASAIMTNITAASYTDAAVATHAAILATTNTAGHIIIGAGLSVDSNGVVTATASAPEWANITGDQADVDLSGFTDDIGIVTGTPWQDEGYITSYIRTLIAAGPRITVATNTVGDEVTYTITADEQAGADTPTLQAVTTEGSTTTNIITAAGFVQGGTNLLEEIQGKQPAGAYLTTETDPIWTAVSNTVTSGAAAGATAVQPAALDAYVQTNHTGDVTIDGTTQTTRLKSGTAVRIGNYTVPLLEDTANSASILSASSGEGPGDSLFLAAYWQLSLPFYAPQIGATNITATEFIGGGGGLTGVSGTDTNALDLAGERPMTGVSVTLARDVRSRDATSADFAGAAFGFGTVAGGHGAAFGNTTTAGEYGASFGYFTTAGRFGFAAGAQGKGGPGSFVFADDTELDFTRTTYTNWFSVRAGGGTYFETPEFEVSGDITANAFVGDGSGLTGLPSGGTVTNLNDLADVSAASPSVDDGIFWDGTNWVARAESGGGGISESTATNIAEAVAWDSYRTPYTLTSAATVTVTRAMGNLIRLDLGHNAVIRVDAALLATNSTFDATIEIYRGSYTPVWPTTDWENADLLSLSTNKVTTVNAYKPQREGKAGVRQ